VGVEIKSEQEQEENEKFIHKMMKTQAKREKNT
jgi:hypothetical protein